MSWKYGPYFNSVFRPLNRDRAQGDYAEIVREQDGQKFTSFESFLVIIQFESYLLHKASDPIISSFCTADVFLQTPCSYCHSAQVECEPRKASGNGKAKCTQCVNRKTKCSLASIPRQIFNIQFVTDPGSNAMPTASTEPDEEMGESPTGTTNPSGTTTPEADSSDGLEEALRALDLMICETEEELSKVFGSITTKMADVLYATPIKRFPLGSSH